jgi:hypothetical protein
MTLDLYGHLFPDRLDELADRFDDAVCARTCPRSPPPTPRRMTNEGEAAGRGHVPGA